MWIPAFPKPRKTLHDALVPGTRILECQTSIRLPVHPRSGWQIQFTEADRKMPLPRKLTLLIRRRSGSWPDEGKHGGDSEGRQMLEHAIETGRGGVY
jgi:hypothetical protein